MKLAIPKSEYSFIHEQYQNGMSLQEIADLYHVSRQTIHNIMKRIGIPCRPSGHNRTHQFNRKFFHEIDSEEKAYWLGFITADGNIWKYALRIDLQIKDKDHLKKFAETIDYHSVKFYDHHNASCLTLNSKEMINDLKKWGVVPAKTFKIFVPNLRFDLYRHFFRGYVDGDGGLYNVKKSGKNKSCGKRIKVTSGSQSFLLAFKGWIDHELGICVYVKKKRLNNAYDLNVTGNGKPLAVANLLYHDCTIALDRKQAIYEGWLAS